jgi:hypothetical protein
LAPQYQYFLVSAKSSLIADRISTLAVAVEIEAKQPRTTHWSPAFGFSRALPAVTLGSAVIFQGMVYALAKLGLARHIQDSPNAQPTFIRKEIADTFLGFGVVVGAMIAWPLAYTKLGMETALRSSIVRPVTISHARPYP